MTCPTCQALLAAVIARRDDDTPRLILADHYDECGRPERAGFIRASIRRGRWVGTDNIPHRMQSRGGLCLDRWSIVGEAGWPKGYADTIRRMVPPPYADHAMRAYICRGFLEEIECPWQWWLQHADAIRAACPLRRVKLTDIGGLTGWAFNLRDSEIVAALGKRWPGLEFELPPADRGL